MKRLKFHRAIVAIAMMLIGSLPSLAHHFEINGVFYNVISTTEVEVTYKGSSYDDYNEYKGSVVIPSLVEYGGFTYSVTAICVLLLIIPKTRKWFGLPLTGSAVLSVGLYQLLKYRICRARPDAALHLIEQGGFSFPSGHTLSSILVWGTLILLLLHYRRTAYISPLTSQQIGPSTRFRAGRLQRPALGGGMTVALCVIFAVYSILMGLSRIYVGVHWPTDVLGSWCLGLALLAPISKFVEKI